MSVPSSNLTAETAHSEAARATEHFVTLFDSGFLPIGLTLYHSLAQQATPFKLWVICMDEAVERQLRMLDCPDLQIIPLRELETAELLAVKPTRDRAEYCWTLTPFSPQAVFDRDDSVRRVTYVDADVFFFNDPQILLQELVDSGKHVLITEHAYAPEYDHTVASGRFCVQFVTFDRSPDARRVMHWWQQRCLEWCYRRAEDGKFGDQKYLDHWPSLFGPDVHILQATNQTLAPWNVRYVAKLAAGEIDPVMYHFHGLRLHSGGVVRLVEGYRIGHAGLMLYRRYLQALSRSIQQLEEHGITIAAQDPPGRPKSLPQPPERFAALRRLKRRIFPPKLAPEPRMRVVFAKLDPPGR